MTKTTIRKKSNDTLVRTIEKRFGVDLKYHSDAQMHAALRKRGLPSLSKLLKMKTPKKSK